MTEPSWHSSSVAQEVPVSGDQLSCRAAHQEAGRNQTRGE